MKENVAIIFGGKSVEREVSLITAIQTMNNINLFKFNVIPIYIDENGLFYSGEKLKDIEFYEKFNRKQVKRVCFLPSCTSLFVLKGKKIKKLCDVDAAINCCHGTSGEDGSLAGIIKFAGIPFCSPSTLCGALSMSKSASKIFFKGLDLEVLPSVSFNKLTFENQKQKVLNSAAEIGFPLVVKPNNLGSSVAVSFCKNEEELSRALELAFNFDNSVIIEKGLEDFNEFFCSARGNYKNISVSEVEKTSNNGIVLSFDDKYLGGGQKKEFPAKIDKELKDKIKQATKSIYQAMEACGVIRVDFLFDKKDNTLYVNEANTVPGSLAYSFWAKQLDFDEFLEELIIGGRDEHKFNAGQKFNFSSNILKNFESVVNKLK